MENFAIKDHGSDVVVDRGASADVFHSVAGRLAVLDDEKMRTDGCLVRCGVASYWILPLPSLDPPPPAPPVPSSLLSALFSKMKVRYRPLSAAPSPELTAREIFQRD